MCVIIHQPPDAHLEKEDAKKLWEVNSDGGGFAFWDDDDKIVTYKTMKFSNFWSEFEQARSTFGNRDYLLHMRIATHGGVNIQNVHPFPVDEQTVMAHNGIIHGVVPLIEATDDRSDTRYFIDEVLPALPEKWLDNYFLADMVNDWIGWSKLMFLTTNPDLDSRVYRFGDWSDWKGMKLSNLNGLVVTKKYIGQPATHYSESSLSWEKWEESKKKAEKEVDEKLTEAEIIELYEEEGDSPEYMIWALGKEREQKGLLHPIVFNVKTDEFFCTGCEEDIDINTAECECWELVCGTCLTFIALCDTRDTECKDASSYHYAVLTDKGKELVNNGGRYNKTVPENLKLAVAKELSQLPSNTRKK